ncbi:MAG: pitrilysin family protein [Alphaproteobacteria bacterium]|nr:pitrilysin family protein [Alphaproteobacteria bacterium]
MIRTTSLPNGIRVVTDSESHFESVTLGVWVGVGSRFETPEQNGYSHFLEHMCFKGTLTRDMHQITGPIESAGGKMNAWTNIAETAYHAKVLKSDVPMALDIIADMVQHAVLPPGELEKEKGVIIQEINMYNDRPDIVAEELFMACAYPNQPLGRPIIGPAENIRNATADGLRAYMRANYASAQMVVSAAGAVDHDAFAADCARLFRDYPANPLVKPAPARYAGGDRRQNKDIEQLRINLGFAGVSYTDDDYYAAQVLACILGQGFTSRLFREIREKRGLVYSIRAHMQPETDTGLFYVEAGTGAKHIAELLPVLCDEIVRLPGTITDEEIARTKTLVKAEWLMSRESTAARADKCASDLLIYGRVVPTEERLKKLESVSAADLKRAGAKIFSGTPTLAAYGPVQHVMEYDELCRRLNTKKDF